MDGVWTQNRLSVRFVTGFHVSINEFGSRGRDVDGLHKCVVVNVRSVASVVALHVMPAIFHAILSDVGFAYGLRRWVTLCSLLKSLSHRIQSVPVAHFQRAVNPGPRHLIRVA